MRARQWQDGDLESLLEWIRADPGMLAGFGVEKASDTHVFDLALRAMQAPNIYWCSIETEDGELAGLGVLTDIDTRVGSALSHLLVAPAHRGKGVYVGREALRHAFEDLGLKKLVGLVPKANRLARRVDERLGFTEVPVDLMQMTVQDWLRGRRLPADQQQTVEA